MNIRGLLLSRAAALSLPLAWMGAFGAFASAQQTAALPPPLVQPPENVQPGSQPAPERVLPSEPLGAAYESLSAGISFRPPSYCKLNNTSDGRFIAEWSDPARGWTLKLGRMTLDRPAPLMDITDNFGKLTEGMLNQLLKKLQADIPGCNVLNKSLTNTRDGGKYDKLHPEYRNNVGLIAIRYTHLGQRRFSQQAIIQANEYVYYLLTLSSPGKSVAAEAGPDDPGEVLAADTFSRMIDSVRLLDRKAIKLDQDDRLFHTREALVNWTPEKMRRVLIPERWFRILRNGKDIGYNYITEETAAGIPKPLTARQMEENKGQIKGPQDFKKEGDGILVGVSGRMILEGIRSDHTRGPIETDSSSWLFTSADKKHEDFSRMVITNDHIAPKKGWVKEIGLSDKRVGRVVEHVDKQGNLQPGPDPDPVQPGAINPEKRANQTIVSFKDDWQLDVNQNSNFGMADPLNRRLPAFYVSQALAHLLPRLLPLDRPQGFMFATYISDTREIELRYIDVLPEQRITFNGSTERAVPIRDRLGLQGAPTFHYVTIDGQYLGSENKEQKLLVIPSDAKTVGEIWKDMNLTKPVVEHPDGKIESGKPQ